MSRWGLPALWALFTVVAVASGLTAVAVIGQSVTADSDPVMSAYEVRQSLAAAPTSTAGAVTVTTQPSASPSHKPTHSPTATSKPTHSTQPTKSSGGSPSNSVTPSPSDKPTKSGQPTKTNQPKVVVRSIASRGGSVVAQCTGGVVYLRSWSPANGYRVDEVARGPASEAEVHFHSATTEVNLHIRCRGGVPTGAQEVSGDGGESVSEQANEANDN